MNYNRVRAMQWLSENITEWPEYIDNRITGRMVSNWRFVDTLPDRVIVFGNCLEEGITKEEWMNYVKPSGLH